MWKYQEDQRAHHKAEFFKKHPYNYQDWMKHWARMEPKIEEHFHKKEYAKFIQMNKRCLSREQLQVENQSDSDKTESITFNSATYGYYVAFLEFQLTALAKDGTTVHDIESPPFRIEVVGQEPVNYKIQSKRGHLKLAFDKIASSVDTFNVTIPQADDAGIKWSLQVTGYGEKPDLEYMTDVASGATTAAELAEPSVAAQLNESVLAKPAMKSATAALKSAVDSIDAENIVENALTALGGSHGTGGTRKAVRTQRSAQTTRRSGSGSSTVITK